MKYKKRMIILVLAIFLFTIAAASAGDVNDTAVASEDMGQMELSLNNEITEDNLQMTNENNTLIQINDKGTESEILSAGEGSFLDLRNDILNGGTLTKSYYKYQSDSGSFVEIKRPTVIDGRGAVIDMSESSFTFIANSSGIIFKNLTIMNGVYNNLIQSCIFYAHGSFDNYLIDCNFINNKGTHLVYFDGYSSGEVMNCNFINNTAVNDGSAVFFTQLGRVTNCNFSGNSADYGGVIYFTQLGRVTNCNFNGNSARKGGAIYFNKEPLIIDTSTITNCNFTDNTAVLGGAIYMTDGVMVNMTNCNFNNNAATDEGGSIYLYEYARGYLTNCNFIDNTASSGGAIYLDESAYGRMTNCGFTKNTATNSHGGAIYFNSFANGYLTNCNFTDNRASMGGAVFYDLDTESHVSDCIFINNTATVWGGALSMDLGTVSDCIFTDNSAAIGGGAISSNGEANVINCKFTDNTAVQGGAINAATGYVTRCNFTDNTATSNGGAIMMSFGSVETCKFIGNNATTGSAIYISNPIYANDNAISNSIFLNNRANSDELQVTVNQNNVIITFTGNNNFMNAIYANGHVDFTNVTYWGADGIINARPIRLSKNLEAGQNVSVVIVVDDVIVINDVYVTDEAGRAVLSESVGRNYLIIARHDEDTYYTEAETILGNMKLCINVTDKTTTNKTVNITATSNFPGNILKEKLIFILPDGTRINATYATNGTWWAVHTFEDYGVYQVNASYNRLDVTILNGTINITRKNSTLILEDIVLNFGESLNYTVETEGAIGITAKIDGNDVRVTDNFTIPISDLDGGNHTLTVTTIPYDGYLAVTKNATVTVNKLNTSISVEVVFGETINDVHIVAKVNESATGLVEFVIGDIVVYVPVNSGEAVYRVYLPIGNYTVNVNYTGDRQFNSNSTYKVFTVKNQTKKDTMVIATPMVNGETVSIMVVVTDGDSINSNDLIDYLKGLIGDGSEGSNSGLNSIISEIIGSATGIESGDYSGITNTLTGFINDYINGGSSGGTGNSLTDLITNIAGIAAGDAYGPAGTIATNMVSKLIFGGSSSGSGSEGLSDINDTATIEIGNVKYAVDLKNGIGVLTDTFNPGNYDADVEYPGNDEYNPSSTSTSFTVTNKTKKDTTVIATPMVNGETVSIMVVVTDEDSINSNDLIDYLTGLIGDGSEGSNSGLNSIISEIIGSATGSESGDYSGITNTLTGIISDYLGGGSSGGTGNSLTDLITNIAGVAAGDAYGPAGTIATNMVSKLIFGGSHSSSSPEGSNDINGMATIEIENVKYAADLKNGIGVLTTTFKPGKYDADVNYLGNDKYNPSSTSTSFTVKEETKKDTTVIATPMVNGETVSIMVVVTDENSINSNDLIDYLTGLIGDGTEGSNNGLNSIISEIIGSATGTESGDYSGITNTLTGIISDYLGGGSSGGTGNSLTDLITNIAGVAAGDAYGPAGTIATNMVSKLIFGGSHSSSSPEGSNDINGMATIEIENVKYAADLKNGIGVLTTTFKPGNYDAEVNYLGNDKYNPSSTSTSFTVTNKTKKDTTVIATPMVNGETVSIMVVVTDENSINTNDLIDYLTGLIGDGTEGSNNGLNSIISEIIGTATGIESGDYSGITNTLTGIISDYLGSGSSGGTGNSLTDLITNIAGVAAGDAYGPAGTIAVDLVSKLIFGGSNSGSGSEVSTEINGMATIEIENVKYAVDLKNGMGVLTTTFKPGNYDAEVNYLGNNEYNPSSTSTSFTVTDKAKTDTKVIANSTVNGESVSIRVVVTDKNNDNISEGSAGISGMATIEIENVKYAVELKNGTAVFNSTFKPGDYEASINYLGNNEYNPSNTSTSFTVKDPAKEANVTAVPSVNGKTVTINITVSSDETSAVPTGNVTVGVLGQKFLLPLDNGIAVFTYDFFSGTYNATVIYYGDDKFYMASTDVSFTVTEILTELKNTTIDVNVSSIDNDVTITASVNPMASGLIEFNIEGDAVYIAVNNGKAVYKTNLPAGDYEVSVTYMGDSRFNANSTTANFTVSDHVKQNTTIEYDVVSSEYGANITVAVNERATGFIEFTLNGSSVHAKVVEGKATWNTMLLPGNYVVTATYLGDDEFNSNTTDIPITINGISLKNTTITANASVIENNITITVNVDPDATGLVRFNITGAENYTVYAEIENGQAILEDTLKTGNYTAVVTYMGDNNFNPNSTELEFTVAGHIKKDTPITANATVNEDQVTIDVNVDLNATGYVTFSIMGKTLIAEITDGKATLTDFYNPGTYQADVEYLGDDNYNANSTTVSFTVIETDSKLKNTTIDVDVVSNENNVTITAKVDSLATGLIEFNIEGKSVYLAVNNGIATYETILAAGNYSVDVTYLGDERFNPNRTSKEFTVTGHVKKNTTVIPDANIEGYDVVITVSVDSNATGFVKLVNGEKAVNVEVIDGKATYEAAFLPGKYTMDAIYLGDEDFNANETKFSFTVDEIPLKNTTVTANVTVDENNVKITANVNPNATGLVRFEVRGPENYTVYAEIENGQAILNDNLMTGNYTAIITYMGNDNFNPNSTELEFTVTGHIKKDTPITAVPAVSGDMVTITVNVDPAATGHVTFSIMGKTLIAEITDGKATLTDFYNPETYQADIEYLGDENYNANSTTVTFTVIETDSKLKNTTIDIDVVSNENDVTITAKVDSLATGLIEFNIEGQAVYIAVKNGIATYKTILTAGDYNVTATYIGDSHFNPNRTSKEFTVTDHIKKNTTVIPDVNIDGYDVVITVSVDSNATGFVKLVNAENAVNVEVIDGKATYEATFLPGKYTMDAIYLGDEDFNANETKFSFTVDEIPLKNTTINANVTVAENNIKITANVNPNATGLVRFDITGAENYTVYAEIENGQAILNDNLKTGNYTAIITYMGDDNFNPNSTDLAFTVAGHVKKDTPITAVPAVSRDMVTITVNVDPAATGHVTFSIMGKTLIAEITDGKAILTDFYNPETYQADVEYLGDENYNANSTTVSFTVIETDSKLKNTTIDIDVVSNENNVTITAKVDSLATGLIEFNIEGQAAYIAVKNGIATYKTTLAAGDYNVTATYLGDLHFNPNRTSKEFTVTDHIKKNTTIVADVSVVENNMTITVNVDPNATGLVRFEVRGPENYTVYTDVENGQTVLEDTLKTGDYTAVITYMGDDNYNANSTTVSFTVGKKTAISLKASRFRNITVRDDLSIYIVLKDETDNIIANAPITYTVNGVAGTTITAADGSFTIQAVNGANVFIKYAGNETILPTNLTLVINVQEAPVVVKIATHFNISDRAITINGYAVDGPANEQGIYYATTLLDANGKPVSNAYIEFALNNKIYNRTTYENGSFRQYKLNMIRADRYTMAFTFGGDENYTPAFACVCVDLDKKPLKIKASSKTYKAATKTKTYTVTLSTIKSLDGKMYLSPKVLRLTVNGRTFTAKTNAKYQATFKITNLKKTGKYTAKITYKGDRTYEAASKKVTITVK